MVTVFVLDHLPSQKQKDGFYDYPNVCVPVSQFLKQQTSVHKSSGAEIFYGNRCWKRECKINVTVRKYFYLGFRLSVISKILQKWEIMDI